MDTESIPLEVMKNILGLGLVLMYFLIPTFVVAVVAATYRYYMKLLKHRTKKEQVKQQKKKVEQPKEKAAQPESNTVDSGNSVEVEVSGLKLDFDEQGKIARK